MRQPYAFPKSDSQIMLETWHGTPLKRLVFDMDDVHSANPKYKQIVYKQSRKWDYLLSDNGFSTEVFQSCFMFDKEKILELGYPANDPMYDKNLDVKAAELKRKIGVPLDKKVLLYAPTWRDDNMYGAGEYKFELALDLNRLHKEFGDEYVILRYFSTMLILEDRYFSICMIWRSTGMSLEDSIWILIRICRGRYLRQMMK